MQQQNMTQTKSDVPTIHTVAKVLGKSTILAFCLHHSAARLTAARHPKLGQQGKNGIAAHRVINQKHVTHSLRLSAQHQQTLCAHLSIERTGSASACRTPGQGCLIPPQDGAYLETPTNHTAICSTNHTAMFITP